MKIRRKWLYGIGGLALCALAGGWILRHPYPGDASRFSGKYTRRVGMGSAALTIDWDGDYSVCVYSDMGHDPVSVRNGSFRIVNNAIQMASDSSQGDDGQKAQEYQTVRWGNRHYLIPTEDMISFCKSVNDGEFIQTASLRWEWLADGDEKYPLTAQAPEVPTKWRVYLLPKVLRSHITH